MRYTVKGKNAGFKCRSRSTWCLVAVASSSQFSTLQMNQVTKLERPRATRGTKNSQVLQCTKLCITTPALSQYVPIPTLQTKLTPSCFNSRGSKSVAKVVPNTLQGQLLVIIPMQSLTYTSRKIICSVCCCTGLINNCLITF